MAGGNRARIGKPFPEADVRVIDSSGQSLPPRQIGEVVARVHAGADFTYHGDDQKRRDSEKAGLIAPAVVLRPYSVPCGPFSTSARSMSNS